MDGSLEAGLRFVHYALLLGLFGWTAFATTGLGNLKEVPRSCGGLLLVSAAVAAPVVSLILMLVSIAAMMGLPLSALDGASVRAIMLETDMGMAFQMRGALLVAALSALLLRPRWRGASPMAAMYFAGALATLGWSGHAAAGEGWLGFLHRANNALHLLTGGLWLGAIGRFLALTVAAHRRSDPAAVGALLDAMHRFAPLGVALVGAVALTGLLNAQLIFGLENGRAVLASDYGVLLVVKVALVGGMLAFGAFNASRARRGIAGAAGEVRLEEVRRSLAGELLLAMLVLGLVAILGRMPPMPM